MATIKISKLVAARNQLMTAISLWFADSDPVSIHALAYASHEIIHSLYRKAGHKNLLFDSNIIKEEHRKEYSDAIKKAGNFFKHAQHDLDAILDFDPKISELFMTMSVVAIYRITEKQLNDIEMTYIGWLQLHNPSWFGKGFFKDDAPPDAIEQTMRLPKGVFFQAYLNALRDARK